MLVAWLGATVTKLVTTLHILRPSIICPLKTMVEKGKVFEGDPAVCPFTYSWLSLSLSLSLSLVSFLSLWYQFILLHSRFCWQVSQDSTRPHIFFSKEENFWGVSRIVSRKSEMAKELHRFSALSLLRPVQTRKGRSLPIRCIPMTTWCLGSDSNII